MKGVQRGQGSPWSPDSPLAKSGELRAPCCQPGQALRVESVGGLHIGTEAARGEVGPASPRSGPSSLLLDANRAGVGRLGWKVDVGGWARLAAAAGLRAAILEDVLNGGHTAPLL